MGTRKLAKSELVKHGLQCDICHEYTADVKEFKNEETAAFLVVCEKCITRLGEQANRDY